MKLGTEINLRAVYYFIISILHGKLRFLDILVLWNAITMGFSGCIILTELLKTAPRCNEVANIVFNQCFSCAFTMDDLGLNQ